MKNLIWLVWMSLVWLSPVLAEAATDSHYVINGGEVYDKDSDLTWQRCSVGQRWQDGAGCSGDIQIFTFQDAQRQSERDWRVPTKEELAELIDHDRQDFPTIDQDAFPGMSEGRPTYWTSTPNSADRSWDVRFEDGYVTDDVNVRRFAVRLVRSGK